MLDTFTRRVAPALATLALLTPASVLAATKNGTTTLGGAASNAPQTGALNPTTSSAPQPGTTRAPTSRAGGANAPATSGTGATSTPATGAAIPPTATTPATTTPPSGTAVPRTRAAAPARKKGSGRRISTGAAIIAALAALLVLGAAAWALARRFAYEPSWWLGVRHSFAEASFRTSATWAALRDWARIGR